MSTAARKARKRAGIPFTKTPKQGTPLHERYEYNKRVQGAVGTRFLWTMVFRNPRALMQALQARAGK